MTTFVGRLSELRKLHTLLEEAQSDGLGKRITLTGPAGVGKSRLLGEFLRRARVRSPIWAARPSDGPLADFLGEAEKMLPAVIAIDNATLLDAAALTDLRKAWTTLAQRPILLILSGRSVPPGLADADEILLRPFNPAELASILSLEPVDAFDAYLASGGHPDIAAQWPTGAPASAALGAMVSRSPSVFEVRAELTMARSWPAESATRAVLESIGPGETSRAVLGRGTALAPASLDRALKALTAAGEITVDRPVSTHPSREARYRLTDPYLRTWMHFLAPLREELARGSEDAVAAHIQQHWAEWRSEGMRIIAREAMHLLAAAGQLPGTGVVGGYWTRFDDVQVDLVGLDSPAPGAVTFVGSLTWDPGRPFDHFDLATLIATRDKVPGAHPGTPLVGVTAAGSAVGGGLAAVLGPAELLTAWGPS